MFAIAVRHFPFASRTSRLGDCGLRQRDVDARVGRVDPAAEEEKAPLESGARAETEHEVVRLDHSLVPGGHEVRYVDVVARPQRGEDVVAALVDRGAGKLAARDLEQLHLHRPRGHEGLVDEDVDRVRVIDGDQLDLVGVRRLPELFRELEDVASIARLERVAGDAQVFLRGACRREGARASHQAERHA